MDNWHRTIFMTKPVFRGPVTINNYTGVPHENMTAGSFATKGEAVISSPHRITGDGRRRVKSRRDKENAYKIDSNPNGRALIINNENFQDSSSRPGSQKDLNDMLRLWSNMGCDVTTKRNLTSEQLQQHVSSFSEGENDGDYYVVVIMSHGEKDDLVVGTEEGKTEVKEIVDTIVHSKRMKNKPKLIFFQICRGDIIQKDGVLSSKHDIFDEKLAHRWMSEMLQEFVHDQRLDSSASTDTIIYDATDTEADASSIDHHEVHRHFAEALPGSLESEGPEIDVTSKEYLHANPDTLLAFATQADHASFRHRDYGSWFIQAIYNIFSKHASNCCVKTMMHMVKKQLDQKKIYKPSEKLKHGGKAIMDHADTFNGKPLYLMPENHEMKRKRKKIVQD